MTGRAILVRAGRAAAIAVTGSVLLATSRAGPEDQTFDAATSCGPAGRVRIEGELRGVCGDVSEPVEGARETGLPPYMERAGDDELVLAGEVPLPGAVPPLTVVRVCRVSAETNGVRQITCDGDLPDASCSGTLTVVPEEPRR